MLSRGSSRILAATVNNNNDHEVNKDDTKYSGYLDGIVREYSVNQTSSDRNPFDFDEKSPKEIRTGTVTKIGQRNLSNWNSYTLNKEVEPVKGSERHSSNRHALTKAKAVALLCNIHNRTEKVGEGNGGAGVGEEEDDTAAADVTTVATAAHPLSTSKMSSVSSNASNNTLKYVSPTKSKGMIKSYRIFESDPIYSPMPLEITENRQSPHNSRRNSRDVNAGVVLPKINETKTPQSKSLFINPFELSEVNNLKEESPSPKSTKSTNTSSINRKTRVRRNTSRLTKRQLPSPSSVSSSSSSNLSVTKAIKLKRAMSSQSTEPSDLATLPPEQVSKYFGNSSKLMFYDTYREISRLRDNILGGNEGIEHYITLPDKDLDHEIDEYSASQCYDSSVTHQDESSSIVTQDYQEDEDEFNLESPSVSTMTGHGTGNGNGNGNGNATATGLLLGKFSNSPFSPMKSNCFEEGSISTLESNSITSQSSKRSFTPSSPRAKFLAGCLKNNVPPRSALLLRDNLSSCIMLEHQGIGDKMGALLSTGLLDVPHIKSINIADNNLTDTSLTLIINAIAQRPSITELNISRNKVGSETARALGNYLRSTTCTIKRLSIRASNVDDTECHQFVEALGYNRCLEELDLSENLLGKDENLNAVKPDTVTAGESFSVLLTDCRCPLKTLKLAWNMIRMEGAIQLCSSLQYQKFLKHLDISFNSLGSEGGLTLGIALLDNHVLEELLIANNSIDGVACFAICVGIREGRSVRYLNIDGNPIGEAGARILMRLPASCGSNISFTARNCDLTMKQSSCWFDQTDPVCSNTTLDMSNPYELAVMYEILDLVARHSSYQFAHVQYGEDLQTKNWKEINMILLEEHNTKFSPAEAETLKKLKKTVEISENNELCTKYFQASDSDGSGELSELEFFDILDRLELSLSERQKISAMTLYDGDHSGAIQLEEFQEFISEVAKDSRLKIRDIETTPRCADSSFPNTRYLPPRRGVFVITIVNGYEIGEYGRALTEEQVKNMITMAKNSSSSTTLMQYAAESDSLRLNEAQEIYNHLVTECGDSAMALAAIIPNMTSTAEAKNLLTLCCGDGDETITNKLKLQFGNAYRPMIGLADGYYSLDFSCSNDRLCMTKLLELSTTSASHRRANQLGDISQDGNWSCFRNEYFSGQAIRLSTTFLSSMPKYGRIEFDFMTSDRFLAMPTSGREGHPNTACSNVICITDRKMIQILIQLNLLSSQSIHWGYDELTSLRSVCRKSLSTSGSSPYWTCSVGRILGAQKYKYEKFYSNLSARSSQLDRAIKREQKYSQTNPSTSKLNRALTKNGTSIALTSLGIVSDGENENSDDEDDPYFVDPHDRVLSKPLNEPLDLSNTSQLSLTPPRSLSPQSSSVGKIVKKIGFHSQDAITTAASSSGTAAANTAASSSISSSQPVYENGIQACAICAKIVNQIEQLLSNKWIFVRHLILLIKCFTMGSLKKTDFGTYRVEVIVSLFCRIKDTHNFHLIFSSLTTEEHGMILARIGILNIFDPLRPEGAYSLDLSVWEERQVCKMLIHIAAAEPGSNWLTQIYQFDRNSKPSSGWVLTVNWYTEEGLPTKGLVSLAYTCGYGIRMNGCCPILLHRRSLIGLVGHHPEFYQYDDTHSNLENNFLTSMLSSSLVRANEMLMKLNEADIKWNYNPPCLMHE